MSNTPITNNSKDHTMPTFSAPTAGGDRLKPADANGHLLLIKPTRWESSVPWAEGEAGIVSDIVDLSTGQTYTDVTWTQKVLRASLQRSIGQLVLATMGQLPAQPGKSPAWSLTAANQDPGAVQAATDYLSANPSFDPENAPAAPVATFKPQAQAPAAPAYQPTAASF